MKVIKRVWEPYTETPINMRQNYYNLSMLRALSKKETLSNAVFKINQAVAVRFSGRKRGVLLLIQPMIINYQKAMNFMLKPVEESILRKLKLRVGQHELLKEDLMAKKYIENDENQIVSEDETIRSSSLAKNNFLSFVHSSPTISLSSPVRQLTEESMRNSTLVSMSGSSARSPLTSNSPSKSSDAISCHQYAAIILSL